MDKKFTPFSELELILLKGSYQDIADKYECGFSYVYQLARVKGVRTIQSEKAIAILADLEAIVKEKKEQLNKKA